MNIKLIKFKNVKSTNDIAIKLVKRKKLKPTLISSEIQSCGRGTMGKTWISQKGNLFLSILFEIDQKKINLKEFTILNVHLIKKIITKYTLKKVSIKWPNDLLIKKEKICGILQEVIYYKDKEFLIVGVGINTNFTPQSKNFRSTSLYNVNKKKINNDKVLKDIKKIYEKFLLEIKTKNFMQLKNKLKINR